MDEHDGPSEEERGVAQVEIEKPELTDFPRILELLTGQDAFHNGLDSGHYVDPNDRERELGSLDRMLRRQLPIMIPQKKSGWQELMEK